MAVALFVVSMIGAPAHGLTFVVDRMDDPTSPMGFGCTDALNDCSLRGAIEAANANAGLDTIDITAPGIYAMRGDEPPLVLADDVNIVGAGQGDCDTTDTCILGSETPPGVFDLPPVKATKTDGPVFVIDEGTATISGVTVRHGNHTTLEEPGATTAGTPPGFEITHLGGGILVDYEATLNISDCAINTNYAQHGGGGIANFGTLTVTNCNIDLNAAGVLGGSGVLNLGTANINQSWITGPIPMPMAMPTATTSGIIEDLEYFLQDIGFCGGVANLANLTLTGTTVSGNVGLVGGGICNTPLPQLPGLPVPSPLDATLVLDGSTVRTNFSLLGGGIWNRAGSLFLLFLFGDVDATVGTASASITNDSTVHFNGALFGGGIMNSRTIIQELFGPAPCSAILGQAFGADPELIDLMMAVGASNSNAATSAPGSISLDIGPATVEINESTVSENFSVMGGGVLNDQYIIPALVIDALGGLATSPATVSGVLAPYLTDPTNVSLVLTDSTLNLNAAPIGGGVANFASTVNSNGSTFSENSFIPPFFAGGSAAATSSPVGFIAAGGGLYNAFGPVGIVDTTFEENVSLFGGGIANLNGEAGFIVPFELVYYLLDDFGFASAAATAAPVLVEDITTLTIDSSTLSLNQALYDGGGLTNEYATAEIINTTFSGNDGGDYGGAIANFVDGHVELSHVTITENTAGSGGGIFEGSGNLTIVMRSSIAAGNFDDNGGETPDCELNSGTITSLGSNLIGNDSGCAGIFTETGDQVGTDPVLGPLELNPGDAKTKTHRLLAGSAAIDTVMDGCIDAQDQLVEDDQRGFSRPQAAACDIGSYEVGCGDGIVDEPGEECDPGDPDPDDCCSDECLIEAADHVCRDAAGVCDAPDTCSESIEGECPEDLKLGSETECRASTETCDPAEVCEGGDDCPEDIPYLDSDLDSVCDGLEPEDTEMDPGTTTIQPPGEDPIVTAEIVGGDCNRIVDLQFLQEEDLPVDDPSGDYPAGLVSVTMCSDDGDLTDGDPCDGDSSCINGQVKVTFEQFTGNFASALFEYRFFDPAGNDYSPLPGVGLMGNMATLNLSDGGVGDTSTNPLATTSGAGTDGRIQDTGGPALIQLPAPAPALPLSGLAMALLTLLGIGGWTIRRRR